MTVYFRVYVEGFGLVKNAAFPFRYPGGELHLKEVNRSTGSYWIADVKGADLNDLGYAALLADVARDRLQPFILLLPYLPAARADKGKPLGARVYADFINSIDVSQVLNCE